MQDLCRLADTVSLFRFETLKYAAPARIKTARLIHIKYLFSLYLLPFSFFIPYLIQMYKAFFI